MSRGTIAPAVKAALQQATLRWPDRNRACDGTIGDQAHATRRSWHNYCNSAGDYSPNGVVCAFDLTHDPSSGCDAHALVRELVRRGDQRVSEAISKGQIWTRARAREGWRRYSGSNPHDKHAHVTVAWAYRNDTSPWWVPANEEDEVTADDIKAIAAAVRKEVQKDIITVLRATDQPSIKSLDTRLTAIEKALGSGA